MDPVALLLDQITDTLPESRAVLRKLKSSIAAQAREPLIRNDALLERYRSDVANGLREPNERVAQILTLNGIRSQSGIATVTVITEPYACPGRCVFCPTEARAPKSYLPNEPAVMRALRNDYDPYRQVTSRLEALEDTGHPTDKVELIIKGGTWSFYPDAYQRTFIQRCVEAANHFAQGPRDCGLRIADCGFSNPKSKIQNPKSPRASSLEPPALLEEAQRENETTRHRVIGITIETRPDYVDAAEIRRLRDLGVTRVELGVQTLEDEVLERVVRDHGTAEVRQATRLLKDAGFKVAYHLMPNLPGASPQSDLATVRQLFEDPGFRPDTMKLYPCVVIDSAQLYHWWREGRYAPYDDETLIELLIRIKQLVPPYVRIERIIRDIPSTSIRAGSLVTNLREEVQRRMRSRGLACGCIRCRQVRGCATGPFSLIRRSYEASDGIEVFLSFEDGATDQLAALLRLRIPAHVQGQRDCGMRIADCGFSNPKSKIQNPKSPRASSLEPRANSVAASNQDGFPVLRGAALIRELHSYGRHLPLGQRCAGTVQHHGLGKRLMEEAERIAREEFGLRRMAVIAGVGVREYYRRLGYELEGTYMVKMISQIRKQIPPIDLS